MKYVRALLFIVLTFPFRCALAIEVETTGENYTVKITSEGHPLYFHLVKITPDNFDYWKQYANAAAFLRRSFRNLYAAALASSSEIYMQSHLYMFGGDKGKAPLFLKQCEASHKAWQDKRDFKAMKVGGIFADPLSYGIGGMDYVILSPKKSYAESYVAFISKKPLAEIEQKAHSHLGAGTEEEEIYQDYLTRYGFIIMSVMLIHNPQAPVTTHFGIFRNPLSFHNHFMGEELYTKSLSLPLHGFAAYIAEQYFEGHKKYMITWPLKSMSDIFKAKIDHRFLHLGTNYEHDKSSDEMLPLLFERGSYQDVVVVKEGVDIRDKEVLSAEDIFYASDERFDFSQLTPPNLRVLVNLEGLIPHFLALLEEK